MKTVEKNGGLDSYLINTSNRNLADKAIKIKKLINYFEKPQSEN